MSVVLASWGCWIFFLAPIISLFFLPLSGMEGWVTWEFTSFLTEFKLYQDDG